MTQEQLQDRIQKSNIKIEKIEKRIKKWQDAKCEKACIKHYEYELSWGKSEQEIINENYAHYIKNCDWELDRAVQDLHDAQLTLEKYQNLLNIEKAKDDEFENHRIMIIWEFLLNYKEQVAAFIRMNMDVLNEYYEVNSESCDWYNSRHIIMREQGLSDEQWKEHRNELNKREKELKNNIHPYTQEVATRDWTKQEREYVVDEAKLEQILLKDCKARYLQLVKEVTEITGIITDAQGLHMSAGELNGIIIGERGKAKVQTFSAGGWNIQCFHYRTRVDEVR